MKNIIQKFVDCGTSNGLLLLDMPTGSGKTYSVLQYISESILKHGSTTKYFFITTLKKNLPENDLRDLFKEYGKEALFDEIYLRIDSNADSVKTGLTDETKKDIPTEIRQWEECKKLWDYAYSLNTSKQSQGTKSLRKVAEDVFRTDIEPAFRKKLQLALSKEFPTVKERIDAIHTNKKWQWVAKLYPAVFTKEKQIIFMSMDKFLVQNSTIVEPSYMLYNSDVINNAVIFIDEFDATKDTILKNIIQNGLRDKVDYIELFKDIHAAFQTHEFPTILTQPSEKRKNGEYKNQSLQSILNGNQTFIITKRDAKQKINSIEYGSEKPDREENNIQIILGKIRGFITEYYGAAEPPVRWWRSHLSRLSEPLRLMIDYLAFSGSNP